MEGLEVCDLPNFEIEMEKSLAEYARIYCDEIGIIVVDLFGIRTVS